MSRSTIAWAVGSQNSQQKFHQSIRSSSFSYISLVYKTSERNKSNRSVGLSIHPGYSSSSVYDLFDETLFQMKATARKNWMIWSIINSSHRLHQSLWKILSFISCMLYSLAVVIFTTNLLFSKFRVRERHPIERISIYNITIYLLSSCCLFARAMNDEHNDSDWNDNEKIRKSYM